VIPPNGGGENPRVNVTPEPSMAVPIAAIGLLILLIAKISRRQLT
jgi:hypothetical protein